MRRGHRATLGGADGAPSTAMVDASHLSHLGASMRRHAITVILLTGLLVPLAACGGGDDGGKKAAAEASGVDCSDTELSQAEWIDNCQQGEAEPQSSEGLGFGKSYRWPDGLEVSVTDAKVITKYGEYEERRAGQTEFRLRLKVTNHGKAPAKLDSLSTIVEGATNGGEAATTTFDVGSDPLEGRLAAGVSATKTDDCVLEKRYGRKIVVTVQRATDGFDPDTVFPEFAGSITG